MDGNITSKTNGNATLVSPIRIRRHHQQERTSEDIENHPFLKSGSISSQPHQGVDYVKHYGKGFLVSSILILATVIVYCISSKSMPTSFINLQGANELSKAYCGDSMLVQGQEGILWGDQKKRRKLKMLQLVIRHGDRSPIYSLVDPQPSFNCAFRDPTSIDLVQKFGEKFQVKGIEGNASMEYLAPKMTDVIPDDDGDHSNNFKACYPGQLTERGFKQQIQQGKYLKSRYPDLLLKDAHSQIYFRSTNYPRTFTSGGALLLGLAPDIKDRVVVQVQETNRKESLFGKGLIGVSRNRDVDPFKVKEEHGGCQTAFLLGAKQEAAFKVDPVLSKQLEDVLDLKDDEDGDIINLSVVDRTDPILAGFCHGHPPLCGVNDRCVNYSLLKKLKEESDFMYCERYYGDEGGRKATRLSMQPFLQEVVKRFEQRSQGQTSVELALYSGHDTVVGPVVAALGGFDCLWPPYASRITMEMWGAPDGEEEEEDMVRLLYNGQVFSDRNYHCPPSNKNSRIRNVAGNEEEDRSLLPLRCFADYVKSLGAHSEGEGQCDVEDEIDDKL